MSPGSSSPNTPDNPIASTRLLWKRLIKGPKTIGTVAPSSPWLARALVGVSALHDAETIVEVGAGTGPLTGWIRQSAPQARLLAVEPDEELRQALQTSHPDVEVSGVLAPHGASSSRSRWRSSSRCPASSTTPGSRNAARAPRILACTDMLRCELHVDSTFIQACLCHASRMACLSAVWYASVCTSMRCFVRQAFCTALTQHV